MSTEQDATRVDLAEDLLSSPPPLDQVRNADAVPPERTPQEWYQHGQVLAKEGYLDDAKSAFRRAILAENVPDTLKREVAQAMETLHGRELEALFSAGASRSPSDKRRVAEEARAEISADLDAETTLNDMERDLGLRDLELFSDPRELARVRGRFLAQSEGLSPQDRLDLGIAWLEMEQFALAQDQFAAVDDPRACVLLAEALVREGTTVDCFQAISRLEVLLSDMQTDEALRLDATYWMARALESLERHAEAYQWYLSVLKHKTGYRDTAVRAERERSRAARDA